MFPFASFMFWENFLLFLVYVCVCIGVPYNQLAQHGALFKRERVLNSVPSFLNALTTTTIGLLMRNLVHVLLQTKECSSQVGRCPLVTTFSKHSPPIAHMLCHAVRGLTRVYYIHNTIWQLYESVFAFVFTVKKQQNRQAGFSISLSSFETLHFKKWLFFP